MDLFLEDLLVIAIIVVTTAWHTLRAFRGWSTSLIYEKIQTPIQ